MKKINWKVRVTNPVFWVQIVLAALTPALAYIGLTFEDITTWGALGEIFVEAYSNPYLLGLIIISVWNSVNDPTTSGTIQDSKLAQTYSRPKKGK